VSGLGICSSRGRSFGVGPLLRHEGQKSRECAGDKDETNSWIHLPLQVGMRKR